MLITGGATTSEVRRITIKSVRHRITTLAGRSQKLKDYPDCDPGAMREICGENFAFPRRDNEVIVGGKPAMLEGSAERVPKPTLRVGFASYLGTEIKALLVSDSEDLSQTISVILKLGWPQLSLIEVSEAREGINLIDREKPDMVMLDLDSEVVGCFDLISQIRSFSDIPIIVLSETSDVMDRVKVLQMGADDCLAQPLIPIELIARVNALLRRCGILKSQYAKPFVTDTLTINRATHEVSVWGKQVKLTPIQYKILCYLVENEGRVVSSAELLRRVWGPDYQSDREILKISIYRLRSKIEEDPAKPKVILNERGIGYIAKLPRSTEQKPS